MLDTMERNFRWLPLISGRSTAGRQDQKRKERRTGKGQAKEREKTTIKTLICYQVIWIFVGAFDHDKSEQLITNTFGYVTLHYMKDF